MLSVFNRLNFFLVRDVNIVIIMVNVVINYIVWYFECKCYLCEFFLLNIDV